MIARIVATNSTQFGSCSGISSPSRMPAAIAFARSRSSARVVTLPLVASMMAGAPGAAAARDPNLWNMRQFENSMAARMRDVVVIGGGPAGSTAATLLKQRGFDVLLLERERFPRFQVGESLLPYNNDLLDRLGVTPRLEKG